MVLHAPGTPLRLEDRPPPQPGSGQVLLRVRACAQPIAEVAVHQGRRVCAFTRPGHSEGQRFARELGAQWAGGSDEKPPGALDAAPISAPDGALIPTALQRTAKGRTVVAGGI